MEVIPQSSSIGALVRGLDLSSNLSNELIEQVNQDFLDYQILFFRDQLSFALATEYAGDVGQSLYPALCTE